MQFAKIQKTAGQYQVLLKYRWCKNSNIKYRYWIDTSFLQLFNR